MNFVFFFGLEKKSVSCDNLLISDVIVEHGIKWTKTLLCCRVSSVSGCFPEAGMSLVYRGVLQYFSVSFLQS